MGVRLVGNYIFTGPGQKSFLVSSNYVNYFELGRRGVTDYYLEGKIEKREFLVSGILYNSKGMPLCNIKENHLENINGTCVFESLERQGYQIVEHGDVVFRLFLKEPDICVLQGRFYDSRGNLIAEGDENDFRIFKGPAVLGKSGNSLGIVLSD